MTFSADSFLQESLNKRKENNSLRKLVVNNDLIDFCSNDYLGFAHSLEVKKAIENEYNSLLKPFNGSGGSRLLAGNTAYAEELEKKISKFHNAASGLIYNSGYDANVGLFSALGKTDCTIIYDELIHASVHDGFKMSSAATFMFRHNDISHLEERLKAAKGIVFVAVESIYSMDGDEALLKEISAICKKYKANLIVDEAHATGVTVNSGKGLVQQFNLENEIFARVHTFGKGLGCHGAIILGSELLRDYLINFSRSFIYTTALPIHSLIAINQSYDLLKISEEKIRSLQFLIDYFKLKAKEYPGIELVESDSPIQCILFSGNDRVKEIAANAQDDGFDVRPIMSPTVRKGAERLRICIHNFNTKGQIKGLLTSINRQLITTKK
jgi:8-amino-7-oxononanoate synthase